MHLASYNQRVHGFAEVVADQIADELDLAGVGIDLSHVAAVGKSVEIELRDLSCVERDGGFTT